MPDTTLTHVVPDPTADRTADPAAGTALEARPSTAPGGSGRGRLTWRGVLRSEWLRLTTTRSTVLTLLGAGALTALIGLVAAASSSGAVDPPGPGGGPGGGPGAGLAGADPFTVLTAGAPMVVLVLAALGVVVGAREYPNGLARVTYAAVPRRGWVLTARVLVLATTAAVVVALGLATAVVVGNAVLAANDAPTLNVGDDGVLRALAGSVAYRAGVAVLGLCAGTLTRSIGSGIGIVVALLLVVPGFGALLLPEDWQESLAYLPSAAGASVGSLTPAPDALSVAAGAGVLGAWLLPGVAAAVTSVVRRDV